MGNGIDITKKIEGLINDIRSMIIDIRKKVAKNINTELLLTYWKIGKLIGEVESNINFDKKSSRQLIIDLSKQLTKDLGSGFSRTNLFNMRKFHLEYKDVQTVSGQISWSHYCELLIIEDTQKRAFYEKETENSKWSV